MPTATPAIARVAKKKPAKKKPVPVFKGIVPTPFKTKVPAKLGLDEMREAILETSMRIGASAVVRVVKRVSGEGRISLVPHHLYPTLVQAMYAEVAKRYVAAGVSFSITFPKQLYPVPFTKR